MTSHPEHAWVWVDGHRIDAVVIYREWAAYQRAAMAREDARQLDVSAIHPPREGV